MENKSVQGEQVQRMFKEMIEFSKNVESLIYDLKQEVEKEIGGTDYRIEVNRKPKGSKNESSKYDDEGWVLMEHSFGLPLVGKGKQKASSCLSYQFSFVGSGADEAKEPLIHVSLWEDPVEVGSYCMGFQLEDWERESMNLVGGRLLTWEPEHPAKFPCKCTWTYSVKLLAVENKDLLKKLLIQPVIELLKVEAEKRDQWEKVAIEKAIPDGLLDAGILQYKKEWLGM